MQQWCSIKTSKQFYWEPSYPKCFSHKSPWVGVVPNFIEQVKLQWNRAILAESRLNWLEGRIEAMNHHSHPTIVKPFQMQLVKHSNMGIWIQIHINETQIQIHIACIQSLWNASRQTSECQRLWFEEKFHSMCGFNFPSPHNTFEEAHIRGDL